MTNQHPLVIRWDEMADALQAADLVAAIEAGFVAYSEGRAVVPPPGELILDAGEVHIKYGYELEGDYYVIKIASGFYENPRLGLPSSGGLMTLFDRQTGELRAILADEGHLTDVRTAVAGAVAAKHLATDNVGPVGIVGTGTQARLQLEHLAGVAPLTEVVVWGRGKRQLDAYQRWASEHGLDVRLTQDLEEIAGCGLIVTCTPSSQPLIEAERLGPGTHITAVGSDTASKQELHPEVLARADVVVADSLAQCQERGEIHHGLEAGTISADEVIELGDVIAGHHPGRTDPEQITVADLTGVAVQDLRIAAAVYEHVNQVL